MKLKWVSASEKEFGDVGKNRHLIVPGSITALCGASVPTADVWQGSTKKTRCKDCQSREAMWESA